MYTEEKKKREQSTVLIYYMIDEELSMKGQIEQDREKRKSTKNSLTSKMFVLPLTWSRDFLTQSQ